MKFQVYQRTEQAGRKKNEDRMGYTYTRASAFFVIADGMGGHAHGELAAQIALETMTELFNQQAQPVLVNPRDFLSKALLHAHHQILHFTNEHSMGDSPRTTLVAMVLQEGKATWVHCGDSRLYWLRGDTLIKRTLDHSYVEQKPMTTNMSAEFLAKMTNRNVLFTCLGSPTKPIYDVSESVPLKHGDKFMLCSDGLWGHFDQTEIIQSLCQVAVDESVPLLIDLALRRGGRHGDNVSAIGIEWEDEAISTRSSKSVVLTKTLSKEAFASTIHKHIVDIDKNAFDDLDIEHSLREINEAIQKTLPKKVTQ